MYGEPGFLIYCWGIRRGGEDILLRQSDDQGVYSDDNCNMGRRERDRNAGKSIEKVSLKVFCTNINGVCLRVLEFHDELKERLIL